MLLRKRLVEVEVEVKHGALAMCMVEHVFFGTLVITERIKFKSLLVLVSLSLHQVSLLEPEPSHIVLVFQLAP